MPGRVIIFISSESVCFCVIEMQSVSAVTRIYSQEAVPVV